MAEFRQQSPEEEAPGLFSLSQIRHLTRVEFSRAQRYRYPLACLVIAVDRIGSLRDLYGYDAKEAIVDDVVRMLQEATRVCDFLGRMPDDRLMVVLPHTPADGSRATAERLLEGAGKIDFEAEGRSVQITLSIGGSHFEDENTLFFDALLESAEDAARQAEEEGGGRYVHRDPGGRGG